MLIYRWGVGCVAQDNSAITPVISKSSADFIEGLIKDAETKGAKLLQPYKREGNLVWPVLIDHVTPVRAPLPTYSRQQPRMTDNDNRCSVQRHEPVPFRAHEEDK